MVEELSDMLGAATLAEEEEMICHEEEEEDDDYSEDEGASERSHYGVADATSDVGTDGRPSSVRGSESASASVSAPQGPTLPSVPSYPVPAQAEAGPSVPRPGPWFSWAEDVENELFR